MTKLEALKSTINFPLPDAMYDKVLIDQAINPTDEYTSANIKEIDLAALGLLFALLTSPDIKEGDFSRTLPDRPQLLAYYSAICTKHGVVNPLVTKPTVKAVSVW